MKAKLKDTGEVVNIINLFDDGTAETEYHSYIKVSKLIFDFDNNDSGMPSENRMRYELSKAAMQGILANPNRSMIDITSSLAIKCADEVIKQLKESEAKK
jgi:hypothetical protein